MMKLEQQVVSLELAKKLKELGVRQESCFYWSIPSPDKAEDEKTRIILQKDCEVMLCHKQSEWGEFFESVSAFTVAELGEMLPLLTKCWKGEPSDGNEGDWICEFMDFDKYGFAKGMKVTTADTEADARAKMLIYLIENNLLTP